MLQTVLKTSTCKNKTAPKVTEKIWDFVKSRRRSTLVFITLSLTLFVSILLFNIVITIQSQELSAYISTLEDDTTPDYGPIIPSLCAFGFVLLTFTLWGISFLVLLFRGAKKKILSPMAQDFKILSDLIPHRKKA